MIAYMTSELYWKDSLASLIEFMDTQERLPSLHILGENRLANWMVTQEMVYLNQTRSKDNEARRDAWEKMIVKYPGLFKNQDEIWEENLGRIRVFMSSVIIPNRLSACAVERRLGAWLREQRRNTV